MKKITTILFALLMTACVPTTRSNDPASTPRTKLRCVSHHFEWVNKPRTLNGVIWDTAHAIMVCDSSVIDTGTTIPARN